MTQRSQGRWGAFVMGLRQGTYCAGCCWLLMALLFVLGVMNLLWIIGLTVFVLLEKVLRQPRWFVHATGVILLFWGVLVVSQKMFA
jgi:predicted metal-binding membrane protein